MKMEQRLENNPLSSVCPALAEYGAQRVVRYLEWWLLQTHI